APAPVTTSVAGSPAASSVRDDPTWGWWRRPGFEKQAARIEPFLRLMAVNGADPESVPRYIVQPGDCLATIAERAGVPLSLLESANPQFARNWNLIHPGDHVT